MIDYPAGAIAHHAGVTPFDWVPCDGRTLDGTHLAFADLWSVIGTTYGGTGISAFMVPNLGGRILSAVSESQEIGSFKGIAHVTLGASTAPTPGHSHTITNVGHTHTPSSPHQHDAQYFLSTAGVPKDGVGITINTWTGGNTFNSNSSSAGVTLGSESIGAFSSTVVSPASHDNRQPSAPIGAMIKL